MFEFTYYNLTNQAKYIQGYLVKHPLSLVGF